VIMPVVTFVFALSLPAALPLYWITTTAFAIVQQKILINRDVHKLESAPLTSAPATAEIEATKTPRPKSKKKKRGKK
jgi:membrane protein insertase Oxa1/YidC/SpoIIIJ